MTNDEFAWGDPADDDNTELVVSTPVADPNDEVATLVQFDQDGKEVITEVNFSQPKLDEAGARDITERIKTQANLLYMLLKRAHAGKAYKALGYTSFEDYVKNEFGFSKVYAYRLINQANFIEAIQERVPEGTEIHIKEPVTTQLRHSLPELLEEVEERIGIDYDGGADAAGDVIEDIIRERREQEANNFLGEDSGEPSEEGGEYRGNGEGGGGDWDDEEEIDIESEDGYSDGGMENANDTRRKFDKIYSLYSGLKSLDSIREWEEIIPFLPQERWAEFKSLLDTVDWLPAFKEQFEEYTASQASDDDVLDGDDDDAALPDDDDIL